MLSSKKKARFDSSTHEVTMRISVCTGEKTIELRDKLTGRVSQLGCVQTDAQLKALLKPYGIDIGQVKRQW